MPNLNSIFYQRRSNDRVVKESGSEAVSSGKIPSGFKPVIQNIGIHSFPPWRSVLERQCEEEAGKFACSVFGKGTEWDFSILKW